MRSQLWARNTWSGQQLGWPQNGRIIGVTNTTSGNLPSIEFHGWTNRYTVLVFGFALSATPLFGWARLQTTFNYSASIVWVIGGHTGGQWSTPKFCTLCWTNQITGRTAECESLSPWFNAESTLVPCLNNRPGALARCVIGSFRSRRYADQNGPYTSWFAAKAPKSVGCRLFSVRGRGNRIG